MTEADCHVTLCNQGNSVAALDLPAPECVYIRVCVCVCEREREGRMGEKEREKERERNGEKEFVRDKLSEYYMFPVYWRFHCFYNYTHAITINV